MTASMIEALKILFDLGHSRDGIHESRLMNLTLDITNQSSLFNCDDKGHSNELEAHSTTGDQEPLQDSHDHNLTAPYFLDPKVGDPISHKQVIELSKLMKSQNHESYRLEMLLRGARIYVPPPPPKPEKTPEFKSLMARLRQEEEMRSYQRITGPKLPFEKISQDLPNDSASCAFSSNYPIPSDELNNVVYADIRRQITLIFNVLISIVACGSAIWIVGKWWSTPMRLALSMGGSILVGIAEIFIFWGYIRRVSEAKAKEQGIKEVKEILKTWVIQPHEKIDPKDDSHKSMTANPIKEKHGTTIRRRK